MRQATKEEIEALPYFDARLKLFFTSADDEFMEVAKTTLFESTDKRHPTAAVVVKDGKIFSMAANQSGYKNKMLIRWHQSWFCIRRWFKIKSGTHYWLCPGCAKSYDHAEGRASRQARDKYGDMVKGSDLYLYGHWWCCKPCSDEMVRAGVSRVILLDGAKDSFVGPKETYRTK